MIEIFWGQYDTQLGIIIHLKDWALVLARRAKRSPQWQFLVAMLAGKRASAREIKRERENARFEGQIARKRRRRRKARHIVPNARNLPGGRQSARGGAPAFVEPKARALSPPRQAAGGGEAARPVGARLAFCPPGRRRRCALKKEGVNQRDSRAHPPARLADGPNQQGTFGRGKAGRSQKADVSSLAACPHSPRFSAALRMPTFCLPSPPGPPGLAVVRLSSLVTPGPE